MATITIRQTAADLDEDLPAPSTLYSCAHVKAILAALKRFTEIGQWCSEPAARVRKELLL